MTDPQRVAVVGATGYAGFELARLLLRHPGIEKPTFYLRESSHAASVNCLTEIFPQLRGWGEAPCRPFSVEAIAASGAKVAFLATPHEASLDWCPSCSNAGLRVVDLSGAFRFHTAPETFAQWYKLPPPRPGAAGRGGLRPAGTLCRCPAEGARLVANPGCYPTSVILGLRPLVGCGLDRAGARHRLRLQVGSHRRRQGTQARTALRRSGRKFPRLWACSRTGTRRK
jgi:N-acetyl-gamma-glutamyl-phosphate reductase